jgi:hypothetical protein
MGSVRSSSFLPCHETETEEAASSYKDDREGGPASTWRGGGSGRGRRWWGHDGAVGRMGGLRGRQKMTPLPLVVG